jgi:hypothetical protein
MSQGNGFVDLSVGEKTNKASGNQFHINELEGSTYAVLAQVRDTNALNVIVP